MTRPADIPEDVWEVACGIHADIVNDEGSGDDRQEIARALMRSAARAKAEQQEADAQMADALEAELKKLGAWGDLYTTAAELATAIRLGRTP